MRGTRFAPMAECRDDASRASPQSRQICRWGLDCRAATGQVMYMGGPDEKPPERKRLKMADIARIAGVDVSTISRALADSPRVTAETKERIRKVVAEHGYIVNHNARQLRAQRSGLVLVMLPNIASSSFAEIVLGVEDAVREEGLNVVIGNTQYDAGREQMLATQLVTGAVDGLILTTGRVPLIVTEMADFNRRIVAVSRPVEDHDIPSVSIDNLAAGRTIAEHLEGGVGRRVQRMREHRRCGLVSHFRLSLDSR